MFLKVLSKGPVHYNPLIESIGPICLFSSFIAIPLVGLILYFINRKCRKKHSKRQKSFMTLVRVASLAVWLFSCLPVAFMVILIEPWPLSVLRDRSTMKRLTETGFIPQNAANIILQDSHGGLHGDGCMFVTFRLSKTDHSWPWLLSEWSKLPLGSHHETTFDRVIKEFSIPAEQLPDLSSASVYYLNDDSSGRRAPPGHLYIQDRDKNQYWYFNVTT